jgi:16S rRNA (cytosine1402-N4)-methyltransferase
MGAGTHLPVMPEAVLNGLAIRENGFYIDCTFGRGGHSRIILDRLGANGRLLALDKDASAVTSSAAATQQEDARFEIKQASFASLEEIARRHGWLGEVAGVLMDLGVSSPQLDQPERGFSFLKDGALDMRMDVNQGITAAQWLADVAEQELAFVLKQYGEERFARRIARAVVEQRAIEPIATTRQLAELVEQAVPIREKKRHPATRCFQAIRIVINQELDDLKKALGQAVTVLKPGGRLVVIAFHSLEDRIVKRFFRDEAQGGRFPRGLPVPVDAYRPRLKLAGKAQRAGAGEVAANIRARSAILRVAERLP